MALRPASLSYFRAEHGEATARGQNFTVHQLVGSTAPALASSDEILLVFAGHGGAIVTRGAARRVPGRSFVIVPAGEVAVQVDGAGKVYALTTGMLRPARDSAVNAGEYAVADPRVKPVERAGVARLQRELRVYPIDEIPFPAGNPRLKFLQTATMSVNWVEYEGPRNRAQLSPHAHADFEQGSLAIAGEFVHHLRTPWGPDAAQWRDDEHRPASADSLLVIPPDIIHTTEGVGPGPHILIDVFAPPRADFIAKGWVHNAADYAR